MNMLQKIKDAYLLFKSIRKVRQSGLFDEQFYLENNPDIRRSGVSPIRHYIFYGGFEGRNPSAKFDGNLYLKHYADVKNKNVNPLVHYVLYGKEEGRFAFGHDRSYSDWIEKYDSVTEINILSWRRRIAGFLRQPLISVIMPVYDPDPAWLKDAINSVVNQVYKNWELCIADDCSANPEIKTLLQWYQKLEPRIKVVFRKENGHISATSNSALELASGEFIALMDHDDLLPETAFYHVVETINKNPAARLIYSDEDKIDASGKRSEPYFKCDWNQELFYGQNFVSHLGVYRADIVKKIGGFRAGYEGSQDYDLALRFIEKVDRKDIIHIPRVLYHWRLHKNSTSMVENSKIYAYESAVKAINDHFSRTNSRAMVEMLQQGFYKLSYEIPADNPLVSIIIPTRNKLKLIRKCVDSILQKTRYTNFEIVIIDNNSDEHDVISFLHKISGNERVNCFDYPHPFNFSSMINYGVSHAKGEFICLMNNDIEVISPDWIEEMLGLAAQPFAGAVGGKLLFPDNTIQHAGVILGLGGIANHAYKHQQRDTNGYFGRALVSQEVSAVTAACLMIRKSAFLENTGFNEKDLVIAFNDIDFCLRLLTSGYRNIYTPFAEFYHYESASRGEEDTPEKKERFRKEMDFMHEHWGDILENDPAYNPNLTLTGPDFSLAWPPRNWDKTLI